MGRGIQRFKTMRGFAKHKGGRRSAFLSKWKEDGTIDVWFHTRELPMEIWRHQIPQIVIREDRDDKTKKVKHVWSKNLVCHETVEVLEAQGWRDKETADRKKPPERCGLCKLIEWCYQQALAYEESRGAKKRKGFSFVTPLFHFEGDDPDETTTLHIGGMCNLFADDDLSAEMKEDMRKAKISPKNAWKENARAKCQYVMMVVDNAHPESGVQIAVETKLLGEKVKEVMDDELDKNDVDIQKSPYCIQWEYREKEKEFGKKYKATALRKVKPTPRILALIRGETPPLSEDLTDPFNQQSLRAVLERHCVLPDKSVIPWDDFFPTKEQSEKWALEDKKAAEEQAKLDAEEEEEGEDESDEEDDEDTDDEDTDEEDEEEDEDTDEEDEEEDSDKVACDECGKPIMVTDAKCPHCGHEYEVADEPKPEPPKRQLKSRSEAAAAKKGTVKKAKPSDDDADGDDLPF